MPPMRKIKDIMFDDLKDNCQLFSPENPNRQEALNWLEKLRDEGSLREIDFWNVRGLIECALKYNPRRKAA